MDIRKTIETQRSFFATGKTRPLSSRGASLRRLRACIIQQIPYIEEGLFKDLGKNGAEAYMSEIGLVLEELNYAIKHLSKWAKPQRKKATLAQFPGKGYEVSQPLGVVLIMAPWNYPFLLNMVPLIGAIGAGNCVVLKPSNDAPHTSKVIVNLINHVFPPHFVSVVEGGREENTQLLNQKFDYIFFTGGPTVGQVVLEKAAVHLTPVTLELGGKSPCIVEQSANVSLAAKRVAFGKFFNSGQTCIAPDYVLIHSSLKEEFIQQLKKWTEKFYGPNPLSNTDYPHMINEKHYNRVLQLTRGEEIYFGGEGDPLTRKIAPTVLINVSPHSPVMQEEIFGPVLPVLEFNDTAQMVDFVQQREHPLALYLFTRNKKAAQEIMGTLSFGGGCVNDVVLHVASPYMSFGGVGKSGFGQYHGKGSFDTFSNVKSILTQSSFWDIPLRYPPYTPVHKFLFKSFLK